MEKGRLVISTSDTTACYRLPSLMKSYREHYPGIDIVVRNSTSLKTIEAVMNYEVDVGIATIRQLRPELDSIPLFPRTDVLICHPNHPLATREFVFLKDLEQYQCVLLDRNCSSRRILDDACHRAKVTLDITMELSSIEVIKHFVRINMGVSIAPEVAVKRECQAKELATIRIKDFESGVKTQMGVVYRKNKYVSLATRKFLEMIQIQYPTAGLKE